MGRVSPKGSCCIPHPPSPFPLLHTGRIKADKHPETTALNQHLPRSTGEGVLGGVMGSEAPWCEQELLVPEPPALPCITHTPPSSLPQAKITTLALHRLALDCSNHISLLRFTKESQVLRVFSVTLNPVIIDNKTRLLRGFFLGFFFCG